MIIQKFGGTSVGTLERVKDVANIVSATAGDKVVVLSAMSGVTNALINCGQEAAGGGDFLTSYGQIKEKYFSLLPGLEGSYKALAEERLNVLFAELRSVLNAAAALKFIDFRVNDLVVSFGECLMCAVFPFFLKSLGQEAHETDARQLIFTDNDFGKARVNFKESNLRIQEWRKSIKGISVVTGFIASTKDGSTTTLSRGGTDYTATIIGGALGAERVEIWTDVDGAMTADPRKVKSARVLQRLTYAEAAEMAYFGAKVIHPLTLLPVRERHIPVIIKNTFHPDAAGTIINDSTDNSGSFIKSVALREGLSLINVEGLGLQGLVGFAGRLFMALGRAGVNVVMISQASSEQSVCIAVNDNETVKAVETIDSEFVREREEHLLEVVTENDICILAVIGDRMAGIPGVSGKLFAALGQAGINVRAIAQGSSERNISLVISKADCAEAIKVVHEAFFKI